MLKMKKRALALGAVAAVAAGLALGPVPATASYAGFPDIPADHWAAAGGVIDWSEENGVVNGYGDGTWRPDAVLDRGTAATILYNHSGDPAPGEPATFSDAAAFGWASDGIAWAQDKDVFDGYADGTFGPWGALTREQACKVLMEYVGGKDGNPASLDAFKDAGEVSPWAEGVVAWAAEEGVITGKGQEGSKNLDPIGTCTRAEFVAMLMRAVEGEGASDPEAGTDPGTGEESGGPAPEPGPGTGDEGGSTDPGAGEEGGKPGTGTGDEGEEPGSGDEGKDPAPDPGTGTDPGDEGLVESSRDKYGVYYNNDTIYEGTVARDYCTYCGYSVYVPWDHSDGGDGGLSVTHPDEYEVLKDLFWHIAREHDSQGRTGGELVTMRIKLVSPGKWVPA